MTIAPPPSDQPKRTRQTQAQIARVIAAAAMAGRVLTGAQVESGGRLRLIFGTGPEDIGNPPPVDRPPRGTDQRKPGQW